MTFVLVMWSVWGALVLLMAVSHVYRSTLTRDEEDQIFLDDSFEHEKVTQAAIVAKVSRVDPIVHSLHYAVAAASAVVVAYYIYEIIFVQLHLL